MALRNYMLNLVSDCAQTNETSLAKMNVTIVSDNTLPSLQNDASIMASLNSSQTLCIPEDVAMSFTPGEPNENATTANATPKTSPVRTTLQGTPGRKQNSITQRCRHRRRRLRSPTMGMRSTLSSCNSENLPRLVLD